MNEPKVINNLKQIRRSQLTITQQGLADAVGCTRQTIIALEQNKYNPSLHLALKLADILGVTVEELFKLQEDES